MLLADEFFFIALDDRTGRPRLSPKVLGLGLAGALVGELVLERRVSVERDRLRVIHAYPPPTDALTHTVLDHLIAEEAGEHPVRTWLVFLARQSAEQVAERLWRAGHIRRERPRRLWRSETIYPPVDINTAYAPVARLANALGRGHQLSWVDVALAGLVVATGLDTYVLFTSDPAARNVAYPVIRTGYRLYPLHQLAGRWTLREAGPMETATEGNPQ